MRLLAVGLALALCPGPAAADPAKAKQVFAASAVQDGLGGGIELRADRRWSTQTHSGDDTKGRLSRSAMKQFRALLAAAPFAVRVDKAACPAGDSQVILVDFERDRVVQLEPPCTTADEVTERLSLCLAALIAGVDASDECRAP
jgi:hypothetical protein